MAALPNAHPAPARLSGHRPPRPFWHPLAAGVALGLVLLLTFVLTGHGLGATGATTRLAAWFGLEVAPAATAANPYLGPMVGDGKPLSSWISWQVIGVALGALVSGPWLVMSALLGNRKARLYDGSLHPWTLEKRPVVGGVPLN